MYRNLGIHSWMESNFIEIVKVSLAATRLLLIACFLKYDQHFVKGLSKSLYASDIQHCELSNQIFNTLT